MFFLILAILIMPLVVAAILKKDDFFVFLTLNYLNTTVSFFISFLITKLYLNKNIPFNAVLGSQVSLLKFIILFVIFFLIFFGCFFYLNKHYLHMEIIKIENVKKLRYLIVSAILAISIFLLLTALWENKTFGLLTPEQIIYNLTQPMEGADGSFLDSFLFGPLTKSIVLLILLIPLALYIKNLKISFNLKRKISLNISTIFIILSLVTSLFSVSFAVVKSDAYSFVEYLTSDSNYIKDNYVQPTTKNIKFPQKKRNLIYIYVESLESTTISKELGGKWSANLLPALTDLARQPGSTHFSDSNKEFGGAQQLPGSGWTIAGLVSQTSGLPLKVPNSVGNDYSAGKGAKFLPGVTSINDILAKNGYNQTFLLGSDATFGGRKKYFTEHGNVKIDDLLAIKKEKRLPKDYHVYWGFEDSKLFNFAKEDATKLSQSNKPFNLTMLTANTHFPTGYPEKTMPNQYGDQYSNVIAYTNQQITDFVDWIKQQPFYDNTTIVIQGDHLSMDPDYYQGVEGRRTFNLIINGAKDDSSIKTKNRQFGTMDMFPTTLSELGVKIKGDRLGLGTDLTSDTKTLIERDGFKKINDELAKRSSFYNRKFMHTN